MNKGHWVHGKRPLATSGGYGGRKKAGRDGGKLKVPRLFWLLGLKERKNKERSGGSWGTLGARLWNVTTKRPGRGIELERQIALKMMESGGREQEAVLLRDNGGGPERFNLRRNKISHWGAVCWGRVGFPTSGLRSDRCLVDSTFV